MARYRLVHFVPDPFLGGRVPMAAIVEHEGGLSLSRVPHVPGPQCLGGVAAASAFLNVLDDLAHVRSFDRLPLSVGPQVILGAVAAVPQSVEDPMAWVAKLLAGAPGQPQFQSLPATSKGAQRATWGMRFLEAHQIDRFVRRQFRASEDAGGLLEAAATLPTVSHFVLGGPSLLLMEPIVFSRENVDNDVQHVATTFGAYRHILNKQPPAIETKLVAYLLHGGTSAQRTEVVETLSKFAHQVVDTDVAPQRSSFVHEVKTVGERGELALRMRA